MFFDAQLQAAQIEAAVVDEQVQLALLLALGLPVSPTSVMAIPAGVLRTSLSKADALKLIEDLTEATNQLPDETPKSDIIVAQSLADVDKAAKQVENLTKGKK